jgi:hypothetical protein
VEKPTLTIGLCCVFIFREGDLNPFFALENRSRGVFTQPLASLGASFIFEFKVNWNDDAEVMEHPLANLVFGLWAAGVLNLPAKESGLHDQADRFVVWGFVGKKCELTVKGVPSVPKQKSLLTHGLNRICYV